MKKIAHLCLCGPFYEGYAYQDNLLPKYHRKSGNEVTIITTPYGKFIGKKKNEIVETGESILKDGIKVIRIKAIFPQSINRHVHTYKGLYNVLNNEKPDMIFVHGVESINYLCLSKYKKKNNHVKIVCDNHTDKINSYHHWTTRLYSKLVVKNFIVRTLVPISDWFYGTTPIRSKFLNEYYGVPVNKIKLLPMGADDDEMHYDNKYIIRHETRAKYGIDENDFLVVTGGKIDKRKNIHILAEAVSKSECKNIKLIVFGSISDDLIETFESLKSNRVKCIGMQPSNEVYRFFYAADFVMFPGLHSVLWEQAVASKVPCAFTHIEGFEHVEIGGNCVLMEGNTAEYYQHLIEQIYEDKGLYTTLFNNANTNKAHKFLYSKIAQSVIDDCFEI